MDKFNPPDPLTFDGNIREHWKRWKQELERYLVAMERRTRRRTKLSPVFFCLAQDHKVGKFITPLLFRRKNEILTTMLLYKNSRNCAFLDRTKPC